VLPGITNCKFLVRTFGRLRRMRFLNEYDQSASLSVSPVRMRTV
jgi:hypothetical protein